MEAALAGGASPTKQGPTVFDDLFEKEEEDKPAKLNRKQSAKAFETPFGAEVPLRVHHLSPMTLALNLTSAYSKGFSFFLIRRGGRSFPQWHLHRSYLQRSWTEEGRHIHPNQVRTGRRGHSGLDERLQSRPHGPVRVERGFFPRQPDTEATMMLFHQCCLFLLRLQFVCLMPSPLSFFRFARLRDQSRLNFEGRKLEVGAFSGMWFPDKIGGEPGRFTLHRGKHKKGDKLATAMRMQAAARGFGS